MDTRKKTAIVVALGLLFLADRSFADDFLDEIIVTAQKREQPAQDIGIAITAYTAEQLRTFGFINSEDLARQTPGLQAASFAGDPTVMLFAIRGVGQNDFTDHHEGPTAVYVDGAYVSTLGALGFHLFDLERVEVLRGPQGTLFGRNATGGLVHYISAKPADEFQSFGRLTVGEYDRLRLEGVISGPLSDTIRGRFSIASHNHDGYLKNRIGQDVHAADSLAARLQLKFDIATDWALLLKLHRSDDDDVEGGGFEQRPSVPGVDGLGEFLPPDVNADFFGLGSCPGCDPLGYRDTDNDVWAGDFDTPDVFNREVSGITATLEWNRDLLSFTSLTDYLDLEKTYGEDSDGSPNPLVLFNTSQDSRQFSQELRLAKVADDHAWTVGVYYLDISGDYSSFLGVPLFFADQTNVFALDTQSWAVFGQAELDFADSWRIVGGLRWTNDDKDYRFVPSCAGVGCVGFFVFPGLGAVGDIGSYAASDSEDDIDAMVRVEYRVDDDVLLYAGVSRGTKTGGFNAPVDGLLLPSEMPYKPEVLTSYEVGMKSTLLDGRLRFNASAFYYDYSDRQAFTFSGLTQTLLNRASTVTGGELELAYAAGNGIDAMLGIAALDATVDDIPLPSGRLAEQQMAQAPDLQVNGQIRKTWTFGPGDLSVSLDGSYVSEQYFNTINHPTSRSDGYTLWNARAAFAAKNEHWDVALSVNNLTEEEAIIYAIDVSAFGYTVQTYAPPRWVDIRFTYYLR